MNSLGAAAEARVKLLNDQVSACNQHGEREHVRELYLQREAEERSASDERARRERLQEAFKCLHDFEPDKLLALGRLLVADNWDRQVEDLEPDTLEKKDAAFLLKLACRQDRQGIIRKSAEIQSMPVGFRAAVQGEIPAFVYALLGITTVDPQSVGTANKGRGVSQDPNEYALKAERDEDTKKKSAMLVRDKMKEARDKWIYEQWCCRVPYDTIRLKLPKKNKRWPRISSKQGILQAAQAYARRHGLEQPPPRQER
jgi:hypothetical protein